MNNNTIQIKIKQRLNKLASNDYDNIQPWQIVEAFNKGQVEWCRRALNGTNIRRDGDEQSTTRIDDLNILLQDPTALVMVNRGLYYEAPLPADYLRWKRVAADAKFECCEEPRRLKIYQVEEGNIDDILRDVNKRPNFEWAETVSTLRNKKVLIYTDEKFEVVSPKLIYYRMPRRIEIAGSVDPYTGVLAAVDVECEFKDDVVELMIGEAVAILAGDTEAMTQLQIAKQNVENTN
jgi:hypothetical protein